jgi:hypothetical protein
MPGTDATPRPSGSFRRWSAFLILLGLYLTLRGYRSFEGDQAYRFPIFRHWQDFRLFAGDPFVRAFDGFNPHRGYFLLLDALSRPLGLAAAVAALFAATFALTCAGLDRLARSVWPGLGGSIGVVAVALMLIAQAGNLGTNHLFEPILLDRLVAFGLGWIALAATVGAPGRCVWVAPVALGLAGLVHPSIGLQLGALLSAGWVAWALLGWTDGLSRRSTVLVAGAIAAAVVPGVVLNLRGSGLILEGLSAGHVRLLAAELQSPQHMLPHLWRLPQWLAGGCYPILAAVAVLSAGSGNTARRRLVVLLAILLAGLGLAWLGIERLGNLRLTLFQPFRMATVARGLCLVLVAGHLQRLWLRGSTTDRLRAVLIGVGLTGDWSLVVVSLFEVTMSAAGRVSRVASYSLVLGFVVFACGISFLSRHDTESGHVPLIAATVATLALASVWRRRSWESSGRRVAFGVAVAWAVPVATMVANVVPEKELGHTLRGVRDALVRRCRFAEVPVDDVERLAVWCRENTPADARFIGPPGPKTFRLWSLRDLAFNRAGSPYAAAGLADWARRFADHVGASRSPEALAAAYLRDRHGLEGRYDRLTADALAALARRQGAGYVVARGPEKGRLDTGALELLHVEGRYAAYRVIPSTHPPTGPTEAHLPEPDNLAQTTGSRPGREPRAPHPRGN